MKKDIAKKSLRFERKKGKEFFNTLNKRVNEYFASKKIQKTGNFRIYLKAFIMLSLLITPYCLIIFTHISLWIKLSLAVLTGLGMAGVGMAVMHDGNHGSFSKYPWVNKVMGSTIYLLAGNVHNWKVQHNILHHTFTNIPGHDEDLDAGRIIRFSPESKWTSKHKYQHIYAFFLYSLLTFNWVIFTDFQQIRRYLKGKLTYRKKLQPTRQWIILIGTKLLYVAVWILLPLLVSDVPWWGIAIGFLVMHFTAGLVLSTTFQLAHIVSDTIMPLPEENKMERSWAIHQLFTTANFSTKNKFVTWFTGGLNHQIEHHIFPHISHIHYTDIAKIVKKTAIEFNLPYIEYDSIQSALISHFNHLKNMGKTPATLN